MNRLPLWTLFLSPFMSPCRVLTSQQAQPPAKGTRVCDCFLSPLTSFPVPTPPERRGQRSAQWGDWSQALFLRERLRMRDRQEEPRSHFSSGEEQLASPSRRSNRGWEWRSASSFLHGGGAGLEGTAPRPRTRAPYALTDGILFPSHLISSPVCLIYSKELLRNSRGGGFLELYVHQFIAQGLEGTCPPLLGRHVACLDEI